MKVLSKLLLLVGLAMALAVSPTFADGLKGSETLQNELAATPSSEASHLAEGFYFPEFDYSMEAFWINMKPIHNSCDAYNWLGGTASATCVDRQNCICTSSFIVVECHCEKVGG